MNNTKTTKTAKTAPVVVDTERLTRTISAQDIKISSINARITSAQAKLFSVRQKLEKLSNKFFMKAFPQVKEILDDIIKVIDTLDGKQATV